ncbi:MAG: hypothetical protein EBZ75_14080 [Oxalobacteraceae bacterium]|nr:hypothetical protein [Oxalobacteraceae bacterium]
MEDLAKIDALARRLALERSAHSSTRASGRRSAVQQLRYELLLLAAAYPGDSDVKEAVAAALGIRPQYIAQERARCASRLHRDGGELASGVADGEQVVCDRVLLCVQEVHMFARVHASAPRRQCVASCVSARQAQPCGRDFDP